jgi:hypothetical protein
MPKKEGTDPKREDLHLTFFFTYLLLSIVVRIDNLQSLVGHKDQGSN